MTETPTERPNEVYIQNENLVRVVELRQNDQMYQGDLTLLSRGGWKFDVSLADSVTAIAHALALQETVLSFSANDEADEKGLGPVGETLRETFDARVEESVNLLEAGLPLPVWRRIEADDAIY